MLKESDSRDAPSPGIAESRGLPRPLGACLSADAPGPAARDGPAALGALDGARVGGGFASADGRERGARLAPSGTMNGGGWMKEPMGDCGRSPTATGRVARRFAQKRTSTNIPTPSATSAAAPAQAATAIVRGGTAAAGARGARCCTADEVSTPGGVGRGPTGVRAAGGMLSCGMCEDEGGGSPDTGRRGYAGDVCETVREGGGLRAHGWPLGERDASIPGRAGATAGAS